MIWKWDYNDIHQRPCCSSSIKYPIATMLDPEDTTKVRWFFSRSTTYPQSSTATAAMTQGGVVSNCACNTGKPNPAVHITINQLSNQYAYDMFHTINEHWSKYIQTCKVDRSQHENSRKEPRLVIKEYYTYCLPSDRIFAILFHDFQHACFLDSFLLSREPVNIIDIVENKIECQKWQ